MKLALIASMLMLASTSAEARVQVLQGTENYEIVCPVDGGQVFIDFNDLLVAMKPDANDATVIGMRTQGAVRARCPGCVAIEFTNGLPGAPRLRVTTKASMVRAQNGGFVVGDYRATVSVLEANVWQEIASDVSCDLNEVH